VKKIRGGLYERIFRPLRRERGGKKSKRTVKVLKAAINGNGVKKSLVEEMVPKIRCGSRKKAKKKKERIERFSKLGLS